MKTGKEKKPAGQIHRQQLFYWMGRSLDDQNGSRKLLRDELVRQVLWQLRGSLERGLWVSLAALSRTERPPRASGNAAGPFGHRHLLSEARSGGPPAGR